MKKKFEGILEFLYDVGDAMSKNRVTCLRNLCEDGYDFTRLDAYRDDSIPNSKRAYLMHMEYIKRLNEGRLEDIYVGKELHDPDIYYCYAPSREYLQMDNTTGKVKRVTVSNHNGFTVEEHIKMLNLNDEQHTYYYSS